MAAEEEEKYGANSELRYITLELMKMAQKRKMTFRRQSQEFVSNAYELAEMLQEMAYAEDEQGKKASRKGAADENEPEK